MCSCFLSVSKYCFTFRKKVQRLPRQTRIFRKYWRRHHQRKVKVSPGILPRGMFKKINRIYLEHWHKTLSLTVFCEASQVAYPWAISLMFSQNMSAVLFSCYFTHVKFFYFKFQSRAHLDSCSPYRKLWLLWSNFYFYILSFRSCLSSRLAEEAVLLVLCFS